MSCYPEEQTLYENMVNYEPESTKGQVKCMCDYMKKYIDFATERKKSDQDVNELLEETKHLATFTVLSENKRIEKEIREEITKPFWGMEITVSSLKYDMSLMGKLLDILADTETAKSRLDKVLVIERFIDISHRDGTLLGEACAVREMDGDKSFNPYVSQVADQALDCLAGRK